MKQLSVTLLALGLFASCGKGNFNGQYAGTEITVNAGQQNIGMGSALSSAITLDLQQNNDVLTGNYYKSGQSIGMINARVLSNDRIDNVQLLIGNNNNNLFNQGMYGGMYSGMYNGFNNFGMNGMLPACQGTYVGSLTSSSDNGTLNGTLSIQSATANTAQCGSIQISVQRGAQDLASPSAMAAQQQAQQPTR